MTGNRADSEALRLDDSPQFRRALGPLEGICIVVGTVIGSGIFLTPSTIASHMGQFGIGAILLVWVVGGLLSLAGALAYAELSAMFPQAGGQYVYLREAFGVRAAFLFGWMEFWVARAGSIAALGVAFANFFALFVHHDDEWTIRWTAFVVISTITAINYLGVRWGGAVQTLFTATKVAALATLVVCCFGLPGGSPQNWQPMWTGVASPGLFMNALGMALVQSLWAYDGWTNGAAVSEEMKNPQRNVPNALIGGTLLVIGIYLAANIAYHFVLPLNEVIASKRVAADVAGSLSNPEIGTRLLAAAVMISTFGALNGTMLTGPRIFYAMARDSIFFHQMGQLHSRFRSPHWSILFVGLWAGALVLIPFDKVLNPLFGWKEDVKLYDQLLTFVIFGSWLFYGLTVAGVMRLRKLLPDHPRPYRSWGYPVVPAMFVVTSTAFIIHTLRTQPAESIAGLVLILAGLPAYAYWSKQRGG